MNANHNRLLVGSELELLAATNNQESDAHISLSRTRQWIAGALLLAGVLAQSGGMFVHVGIGKPGNGRAGNTLSSADAVLLARALLTTGPRSSQADRV